MPGTLEYISNPSRWDCFNRPELSEHIISIEQQERNKIESYPESKRVYQNQDRFMLTELFQMTTKDDRQLTRDCMVYSKSSGTVICFSCKLFPDKTSQFVTCSNDWKNGKPMPQIMKTAKTIVIQ